MVDKVTKTNRWVQSYQELITFILGLVIAFGVWSISSVYNNSMQQINDVKAVVAEHDKRIQDISDCAIKMQKDIEYIRITVDDIREKVK